MSGEGISILSSGITSHSIRVGRVSCMCPSIDSNMKLTALLPEDLYGVWRRVVIDVEEIEKLCLGQRFVTLFIKHYIHFDSFLSFPSWISFDLAYFLT